MIFRVTAGRKMLFNRLLVPTYSRLNVRLFIHFYYTSIYTGTFLLYHRTQRFYYIHFYYIRLRLSSFATFPPIPRHGDSLKISEDSRKSSSVVIWFAFAYPCVSTEDPEEQKCYFLYYYINEIYNIKKFSGSSGTS